MLINGSSVAYLTKADLAHYLRSPDLAQRVIYATKQGLVGWVEIVRDGPDLLVTAGSARRAARRIAEGENPPEYESRRRAREARQKERERKMA